MSASRPVPPGQPVFQLRISLEEVTPPVWRRLLVPGGVRLAKLHDMFQAAMGWTNSHLHSFTIGKQRYGMQFDEYPEGEIDEKAVTVLTALDEQRWFTYEYDFGDSWCHEVVVEDFTRRPSGLKFAVCLEGQRACPPEDCGGAYGYAQMLEIIADPDHDEFDDYIGWLDFYFNPEAFDLVTANAALQHLR